MQVIDLYRCLECCSLGGIFSRILLVETGYRVSLYIRHKDRIRHSVLVWKKHIQPLTIPAKLSILDACGGPGYASAANQTHPTKLNFNQRPVKTSITSSTITNMGVVILLVQHSHFKYDEIGMSGETRHFQILDGALLMPFQYFCLSLFCFEENVFDRSYNLPLLISLKKIFNECQKFI